MPAAWTIGSSSRQLMVARGGRRHSLATSPILIAATALVAAASFAGLLHPRMPARLPLAASALLGVSLMGVGHEWVLARPLDDVVRSLLDQSLAPLRNVHSWILSFGCRWPLDWGTLSALP